ncbi:MAG: cupin domain-containing protein [Chloroflexi bacterium]|nr:cupin domain-containing protein [Chloroflexota bacterium]
MKVMNLLENLEFHNRNPYAEPLYVDSEGRVLRFTLKPGESIREHQGHDSPFYVVVLRGTGVFAGGDGKEQKLGPDSLVIFGPHESHHVRAGKEELVFVGFLHGAEGNVTGMVGGKLGREQKS